MNVFPFCRYWLLVTDLNVGEIIIKIEKVSPNTFHVAQVFLFISKWSREMIDVV